MTHKDISSEEVTCFAKELKKDCLKCYDPLAEQFYWDFDDTFCKIRETTETCHQCGKEHIIYGQQGNDPEYRDDVYLKCNCGHLVHFSLPVN